MQSTHTHTYAGSTLSKAPVSTSPLTLLPACWVRRKRLLLHAQLTHVPLSLCVASTPSRSCVRPLRHARLHRRSPQTRASADPLPPLFTSPLLFHLLSACDARKKHVRTRVVFFSCLTHRHPARHACRVPFPPPFTRHTQTHDFVPLNARAESTYRPRLPCPHCNHPEPPAAFPASPVSVCVCVCPSRLPCWTDPPFSLPVRCLWLPPATSSSIPPPSLPPSYCRSQRLRR